MIPILYDSTTNLTTLGLGALGDALSCTVDEARNGVYELHMTYPVNGKRFEDLVPGAIIKALPSKGRQPDLFRIYSITKPISGIVEVNAEHISYQLSHIPVMPFSAGNCMEALTGLLNNSAESNPFSVWTDISTVANYTQTIPASFRARLGGEAGSILDVYGGEFEFDRFDVKLWAHRGADRGVQLRYGKNITDLNQETNIANTITGVCPYWAGGDGGVVVTLPEKVVEAPSAANFPYNRTIVKDFTEKFETAPTEAELRTAATNYINGAGIGVPDVSIDVSFVDLSQAGDYSTIALLEDVRLCDTVTVIFEPFGISAKAKVVETTWDVLAERYVTITLGTPKTNLASIVNKNEQEVAQEIQTAVSGFSSEIQAATDQITGVNGGYVRLNRDANGDPFELLVMDTPDITTATIVWRWNRNGLGVSNNGYAGPYDLAMTADGHFVADFVTAGVLNANLIKAGVLQDLAGKFYLDMTTGEFRSAFSDEVYAQFTFGPTGLVIKGTAGSDPGAYVLLSATAQEFHVKDADNNDMVALELSGTGINTPALHADGDVAGSTFTISPWQWYVDENGYLTLGRI